MKQKKEENLRKKKLIIANVKTKKRFSYVNNLKQKNIEKCRVGLRIEFNEKYFFFLIKMIVEEEEEESS